MNRYPSETENCGNCKYSHGDCYDRWYEINEVDNSNYLGKGEIINCWEHE